MPSIAEPAQAVTGGVDTHADVNVAAVVDQIGRVPGTEAFPASTLGDRAMLAWMRGHGQLVKVGVEGAGSYGAGLARHLSAQGVAVVECSSTPGNPPCAAFDQLDTQLDQLVIRPLPTDQRVATAAYRYVVAVKETTSAHPEHATPTLTPRSGRGRRASRTWPWPPAATGACRSPGVTAPARPPTTPPRR